MSSWIADRTLAFDSSGIRKIFDLARSIPDPINLSIGQPDFDVPEDVKTAAIDAIRGGKNAYAPTQGIPELREKLQARVAQEYGQADRKLIITSGTSGALVLAVLSVVNPGDEVIVFDPYFLVYKPLLDLVGGRAVMIDTYPDFRIDLARVAAAITPRTKAILLNSPANPTGVVATEDEVRGLAELAQRRGVLLVSDEIYRCFCYEPFTSPAKFNPDALVIDGFSKSHAMTGWRLGFAHGPAAVIETMLKLQQYTFVCAPMPVQWAGVTALDVDMTAQVRDYQRKRDLLLAGLKGYYDVATPGGAFYVFPRIPQRPGSPPVTSAEFIERAIAHKLLIIPGHIFSRQATHFRISYAAPDETIRRGIKVLQQLAHAPS